VSIEPIQKPPEHSLLFIKNGALIGFDFLFLFKEMPAIHLNN
jgi:hypothetical protein